jgi:hypothetical protein
MTNPIDVWNLDTFDETLMEALRGKQQLITNYFSTERANYLEREASARRPPSSNSYAPG